MSLVGGAVIYMLREQATPTSSYRSRHVRTHPLPRVGVAATVALLALGSVAAAGCGGGSSGSSSSAGSATTYNPHHIPKSAPIASSAYLNALAQGFAQSAHYSRSQ